MDKEIEDELNFLMNLKPKLPFEVMAEYIFNNFTEEDLRKYVVKLLNERIQLLKEINEHKLAGKLEEVSAAFENKRILVNGIRNTYLDN